MNAPTRFAIAVLAALCLCLPTPLRAAAADKTNKAGKTTKTTKPATSSKPTLTAKPAVTEAVEESKESKESKFKLKPGAQQKVCLTCHPTFEELLKKPFVHTPLKKTGCTACHSPHTSNHPKQLAADVSKLCLMCHKEILPDGARSTHKVALEGKCVECHDPHAADNKFNLRTAGNDLCFGCHKDKAEAISKVRFKHNPVTKGCVNCHNPHASLKAAALLKSEVPELCKGCHKADQPLFVKQHMNYPVGQSRCTMCHSVHGSDKAGLIYNTAHP